MQTNWFVVNWNVDQVIVAQLFRTFIAAWSENAIKKNNIVTVLFLICRCRIPGFANDTYNVQGTLHHNMIQMYIPLSNEDDKKYDQCHVYQIDQSNTVFDENNSHPINASLVKCSSWVYSNDVFDYTFVVKVRWSMIVIFLHYHSEKCLVILLNA